MAKSSTSCFTSSEKKEEVTLLIYKQARQEVTLLIYKQVRRTTTGRGQQEGYLPNQGSNRLNG